MTTAVGQPTVVGLGEIAVSKNPTDQLVCLGLGSCVCVAVYDPAVSVAGMAHVVLPDSGGDPNRQTAKFADVAIPSLFEQMTKMGADLNRVIIKLAGGAHMTPVQGPGVNSMNIGERNAEAVQALLKKAGRRVKAVDLGGDKGRTVRLWVETGKITVATAGKDQKDF